MKFAVLRSVAHNVADSMGSGLGYPDNAEDYSVYREAVRHGDGRLTVDLLNGVPLSAGPSDELKRLATIYLGFLRHVCAAQGVELPAFRELTVTFAVDPIHGQHFTTRVTDVNGRSAEDLYVGSPGRRVRQRKPSRS